MKRIKSSEIPTAPRLAVALTKAQVLAMERSDGLLEGARLLPKNLGMVLPKRPKRKATKFPTRITRLSHTQIGDLMSFYTAWYGYASVSLGFERAKVAILTRMLTNRKAILFQKFKPEKKSGDWSEAIQGRIQRDKVVRRWETDLARSEAHAALLDTLVWTYMRFADTASREVTRRNTEFELEGRSPARRMNRA